MSRVLIKTLKHLKLKKIRWSDYTIKAIKEVGQKSYLKKAYSKKQFAFQKILVLEKSF